MDIEEHYGKLLGIEPPWSISDISLDMVGQRVDIEIEQADNIGPCPECGAISPKHDERVRRTWRHLDTMQFATYLHCSIPRIRCKEHGTKTVIETGHLLLTDLRRLTAIKPDVMGS